MPKPKRELRFCCICDEETGLEPRRREAGYVAKRSGRIVERGSRVLSVLEHGVRTKCLALVTKSRISHDPTLAQYNICIVLVGKKIFVSLQFIKCLAQYI